MSSSFSVPRRAARSLALIALGAAVLAAATMVPAAAFAHSSIVGSSPEGATGEPGTVDVLPETVSVTFSDDLTEPLPADQQQGAESNTQVRVFDETCAAVADLGADELAGLSEDAVDCRDYATGDAVVAGPTLSQELDATGAPAGTYTVVWQAVYGDGHPDSGSFTFVTQDAVAAEETEDPSAPTAEASPTPTAEASPAPTAETTDDASEADAPADAGAPGLPIVLAIVGGVIVLALIVFIVIMIARSRRS